MKILISAESFGYGPITTALNVVKELKKYDDAQIDFIGSGVSMEQAKISDYFENYFECKTYDFLELEKRIDVLNNYDAFISSENLNGAIFAIRNNIKNVYYIDNLVWMWDKIPQELNEVKRYFISETIPCRENFKKIGNNIKNPMFVSHLRNLDKLSSDTTNQLIINIGGAESFLLDHDLIVGFYNVILNYILSNKNINTFDSIIICGGSRVLNSLSIKEDNPKIKKVTLSHEEYLKEMSRSSHCILSSGLGNFIETIGADKNIMYLPAINYSQLLQLQYYRKSNFGFSILNWDEFEFYNEIPEFLDEELGVNLVVDNIKKFVKSDYHHIVHNKIDIFLSVDQFKYYKNRKKYLAKFDSKASYIVAKTIYDDINEK